MFKTGYVKEAGDRLHKVAKKMVELGEFDEEIEAILTKGGNAMRNRIIKSMQSTKRAQHYYKRGNKKHYPSAPNNPPAIDRGGLVNSIHYDVDGTTLHVGSIINDPEYPRYLEEGTSRMKKRPWLGPAIDHEEPTIVRDLNNILPDKLKEIFE